MKVLSKGDLLCITLGWSCVSFLETVWKLLWKPAFLRGCKLTEVHLINLLLVGATGSDSTRVSSFLYDLGSFNTEQQVYYQSGLSLNACSQISFLKEQEYGLSVQRGSRVSSQLLQDFLFNLQSGLFVEGSYFLGNSSTENITKIPSRD